MPTEKLDLERVKDFLTKELKDVTESGQVKFRMLNKKIKSEFGKGMFLPQLSEVVRAARPDLAKPARKAGKRRGRKPGPKSGRRPGRPAKSPTPANGAFLVKIGRTLQLVTSRDRVQETVDQHLAAGRSLARLKVYALSRVGVTTTVVLE